MNPVGLLLLKVLLAAFFVALFSHLSSATAPRLFSGLFAGAPVVASISLTLTALTQPAAAQRGAVGMVAGGVGMLACCAVVAWVLPRLHAAVASAVGWAAWAVAAGGLYLAVLR